MLASCHALDRPCDLKVRGKQRHPMLHHPLDGMGPVLIALVCWHLASLKSYLESLLAKQKNKISISRQVRKRFAL
jgi:hypothetical protein